MINTFNLLSHFFTINHQKKIAPLLPVEKLRLTEIELLAQGHTASECWSLPTVRAQSSTLYLSTATLERVWLLWACRDGERCGVWRECRSLLKSICKVRHSPSLAFRPPFLRESSMASPLPALSELQSKISAGLEMPVLSSEILDEWIKQDPHSLRHGVL